MIGVIAAPSDREIAHEFFELFKTPWEFWQSGRLYEAVLSCTENECSLGVSSKLWISYAGRKPQTVHNNPRSHLLLYRRKKIPIYGDCVTFPDSENSFLKSYSSQSCVGYVEPTAETTRVRIGYNLFHEIHHLLTIGQPTENASIPTLELHIALLRDLIVESGAALTEIPPVPDGHTFIACLTHDVDHPSIRRHLLDHTALGFIYRATIGSVMNFVRGYIPLGNLFKNWIAALKLPFVWIGIAKDFWRDFDSRYLELEEGLPSTFFVIPFKNRPGQTVNGPAPKFRAARYGVQDVVDTISRLRSAGREVGLHGIDAWRDSTAGAEEMEEIGRLTDHEEIGVRMHWLYFDQSAPRALESAGAAYDSTVGYNETVGYRAGTTQAFRMIDTQHLLELPLHVMDTALFCPAHMGLSDIDAKKQIWEILDNAIEFGGCVTVNWHDRSLAPERLWGGTYRDLVQELKNRGAWIVTAAQAVSWFKERRSVRFNSLGTISQNVSPPSPLPNFTTTARLRVRVHNAKVLGDGSRQYHDANLTEAAQSGLFACTN